MTIVNLLMDLHATYTFNAPPARVWELLIDPAVVAACLPGCDTLEAIGDDRYRAKLTMGIAAVTGTYEGTVAIVDKQPPRSYKLLVDGRGAPGFLNGEGAIELAADGDQTHVSVRGKVQVGGLIARVGQRLIGSVSKMMMDRFFACLQEKI